MSANLKPGDTVIVRPGTYTESVSIGRSGAEDNHITLKSEVPGQALIRGTSWNAVSINANYVTIDGFDISGRGGGDGIEANGRHHIAVLNNIVHDNRESGIQFNGSDFIRVEGNTTYNNASDGWFSGISIYQNRNITGDTKTEGFRTIVRDNISYNNVTKTGQHTDGNGIIIDDFQSTQTKGFPNYTFPTLVENNLVYGNGGKGIQVTWSDYVTVRNNTSYHNNVDNLNTGTWRGELSNSASSNNTWINNIAVANPRFNSNNTAIDNTSTGGYKNQNIVWANNLTFNGTAGNASVRTDGGNAMPTIANGNILGVDPRFIDPGQANFLLHSTSPALNAGTNSFGLHTTDLLGNNRAVGRVDLGAFEMPNGGATNAAPVARDDTGFAALSGKTLIIDAGTLLANDTDANGDVLKIVGVSGPTGGAVSLTNTGDISFTPTTGFTGTARFTYTISDGKGGTDSANVSVGVTAPPATNTAPVAKKDTGFSTNTATPIKIAAATLLANDTDADGDKLTVIKASNAVGGTVALAANGDVVFTPTAGYTGVATFVYKIADPSGATANAKVEINVKAAPPPAPVIGEGLWDDNQVPAMLTDPDRAATQLGVKFTANVDGTISGVSFFRGPAATNADSVKLWTASGQLVASATTGDKSTTGWIDVKFASPVAVSAGETYVATYYAPTGQYSVTENYFKNGFSTGEISVPVNGGVFGYGSASTFPTASYQSSNYWVDLMFTAKGDGKVAAPAATAFAEYGNLKLDAEWKTVSFTGRYEKPTVIAFDMTGNGSDPVDVRVRNVDTVNKTFEICLDEPNYLDGKHGMEKVSWLVVESGTWKLADGTILSAGTLETAMTVDKGMANVQFDTPFAAAPHVFSTVNSYKDTDWATTRHADVGKNGFKIALQEEEAGGSHGKETVGYVAVSKSSSHVKSVGDLTNQKMKFDFGGTFFADIQTTNDSDSAVVRYASKTGELFIQEERSADNEMKHLPETVSVFQLDGAFGQLHGFELLA
jgi:hypothetical protein